jgi:hypothetical protein
MKRISDFGLRISDFRSSAREVDLGSLIVANQVRLLKGKIRNPKGAIRNSNVALAMNGPEGFE